MKLQKFIIAAGLTIMAMPAMAQYEGTDTRQRIAMMLPDEAEATTALQHVTTFQMDINNNDFNIKGF